MKGGELIMDDNNQQNPAGGAPVGDPTQQPGAGMPGGQTPPAAPGGDQPTSTGEAPTGGTGQNQPM